MIRILYVLLTLITFTFSYSQTVEMTEFDNFVKPFSGALGDDNYDGSPYLYDTWRPANVKIGDQSIIYNKVKYNVYTHLLEVMDDNDHNFIEKGLVRSFKFSDVDDSSVFLCFSELKLINGQPSDLVQLTTVGDLQVVTAYQAIRRKVTNENPHLTGVGKDHMVVKKTSYIIQDTDIVKVKKEKDLYKLYPENKKRIKSIIKTNSIDVKDHIGLAFLMRELLE